MSTCGAQYPGHPGHLFHVCDLEPMHGMGGGPKHCRCRCGHEWNRHALRTSGPGSGWTGGDAA